jgi:hypothetical protein
MHLLRGEPHEVSRCAAAGIIDRHRCTSRQACTARTIAACSANGVASPKLKPVRPSSTVSARPPKRCTTGRLPWGGPYRRGGRRGSKREGTSSL